MQESLMANSTVETGLDTEFHRGLGLYDSTMVVVGSMIGSGIFIVSADMARNIGSPGWPLRGRVPGGTLAGRRAGARRRQPGLAARRVAADGSPGGRRRALVRRARRDDAARGRTVRLSA